MNISPPGSGTAPPLLLPSYAITSATHLPSPHPLFLHLPCYHCFQIYYDQFSELLFIDPGGFLHRKVLLLGDTFTDDRTFYSRIHYRKTQWKRLVDTAHHQVYSYLRVTSIWINRHKWPIRKKIRAGPAWRAIGHEVAVRHHWAAEAHTQHPESKREDQGDTMESKLSSFISAVLFVFQQCRWTERSWFWGWFCLSVLLLCLCFCLFCFAFGIIAQNLWAL